MSEWELMGLPAAIGVTASACGCSTGHAMADAMNAVRRMEANQPKCPDVLLMMGPIAEQLKQAAANEAIARQRPQTLGGPVWTPFEFFGIRYEVFEEQSELVRRALELRRLGRRVAIVTV